MAFTNLERITNFLQSTVHNKGVKYFLIKAAASWLNSKDSEETLVMD